MANLTLADLQNEVYDHTGLDSTNSANTTRINRWINYVQNEICARWPWPFLLGREAVVTIADYVTGTVAVTSGSTTVTGTSTAWTSTQGDGTYFIQFSSANDWYRVTSQASATSIVIEKAYAPSTNLSGGTYTLRKFFYSLSSTADEVIDVRNWNTPIKIIQCDLRTIDLINPLVQSSGPGYAYLMFGVDASGNNVFMPYPFASDARLWEFRTKKRPTDMAATTDPPTIPNKYAHVIAWGAIAVGFAYKKQFEEAQSWNAKFEARISEMKQEYRQSEDYQPVLSSIDSTARSRWIQFPSSYPIVGG